MLSDEQLALEAQIGKTDSLDELVKRHHSNLIGFLYRMTGGDRPLAEDLAQESFIRIFKALHKYQYPRPFKSWLYAISINLVRDHYRQAEIRRSFVALFAALEEKGPAVVTPTEDLIQARNETQNLLTALSTLPIRQREVFILRYLEDFSLAEIADQLDIPLGTVKSRLYSGLHLLHQKMKDLYGIKERK